MKQPAVAAWLTDNGVDTTKQAISAWEQGRNLPDPLVLRRLCRLYKVSADSLLWADPGEVPGNDAQLPTAILHRIAHLDAGRRAALVNALSSMLDAIDPPTAGAVATADFAGKPPQHAVAADPTTTPAFLKR